MRDTGAMSVWFVTGASRGFGAEIVEKVLAAGHSVVATARDPRAVAAQFPAAIPSPRLPTNFGLSPRSKLHGVTCRCQRITTTL
jgi:NAD(P)-dependent dehydrogenase (short-subunit alcohol dehydrogenase family)